MFNGSILLPSTVTFSLNHHGLCVVLNVFRMSCDWIFIIKHVKHISRETLEKSKLLRNYAFLAFSSIIMSYLVPISNFKRKCVLHIHLLKFWRDIYFYRHAFIIKVYYFEINHLMNVDLTMHIAPQRQFQNEIKKKQTYFSQNFKEKIHT